MEMHIFSKQSVDTPGTPDGFDMFLITIVMLYYACLVKVFTDYVRTEHSMKYFKTLECN